MNIPTKRSCMPIKPFAEPFALSRKALAALMPIGRLAFPLLLFFSLAALLFSPLSALAQTLSLDMGEGGGAVTSRIIQLAILVTLITLAPSILIMVTSFVRILIVFSFLRTAMGTAQVPPNSVLVSLALFLTFFIMQPTFQQSWEQGIAPLIEEKIDEAEAFKLAAAPIHEFMLRHVRERDLALFFELGNTKPPEKAADTPLQILIPAFMISELQRAFEIGFLIFLPFLIIDMVVSSILMSMGMMMLPPVSISLPFKIVFFVLVDGWHLLVGSLVRSFGGG